MEAKYQGLPLEAVLDLELMYPVLDIAARLTGCTVFLQEPREKKPVFAPRTAKVPELCKNLLRHDGHRRLCNAFLIQSGHGAIAGRVFTGHCPYGVSFALAPVFINRGAGVAILVAGYVRAGPWSAEQGRRIERAGAECGIEAADTRSWMEAFPEVTETHLRATGEFIGRTADYLMGISSLRDRDYDRLLVPDIVLARRLCRSADGFGADPPLDPRLMDPVKEGDEKALIEAIALGKRGEAIAILDDMMARVFAGLPRESLELKGRLMELGVIITRAPLFLNSLGKGEALSLQGDVELHPPIGRDAFAYREWLRAVLARVLDRIDAPAAGGRDEAAARKAAALIAANLDCRLSLEEVAATLGVPAARLDAAFRERYAMSLKEYITLARVESAKRLLAESDMSITDIACALYFWDAAHFTKTFKRHAGMAPSEFRRLGSRMPRPAVALDPGRRPA